MKNLYILALAFLVLTGCNRGTGWNLPIPNFLIPNLMMPCIMPCSTNYDHLGNPINSPNPTGTPTPSPSPTTTPTVTPTPTPTPTYTPNPVGLGPSPVSLSSNGGVLQAGDLGSAGNYVILAKTGVSNATGSHIVGNVGVSPAAATYLTGFSLVADATNVFSTSIAVTGKVYAADYAPPTPANMTSSISSMETSYTDAAGRVNPDYTELANGNLGGLTLFPGLYTWSSTVLIATDLTLSGGVNDVFILQIAGDLALATNQHVILIGGAQAKNVFWVVAGQSTFFVGSHFEGILLGKTAVTLQTNASLNGRIYAQSAVNLDNNVITEQ